MMIIVEVRVEDSLEMSLVENDHVIEALAANRADQAFRVGIGLRRRIHPMVPIRRNFFRSRIPSIHCAAATLR